MGTAMTPDQVRAVYDAQAATFDAERSRALFEASWLERFVACLPRGGRILDLGCGTGDPIAAWLMERGFAVTGLDFSAGMLSLARARWPERDWRQGDMRALRLRDRFDGIVAWDSFFHLAAADQPEALARMAAHLNPAGALLVTVGPEAGETLGQVGEAQVCQASLSLAQYATCLEQNGLRVTAFIAEDATAQDHSVLLARKKE